MSSQLYILHKNIVSFLLLNYKYFEIKKDRIAAMLQSCPPSEQHFALKKIYSSSFSVSQLALSKILAPDSGA